MLWQGFYVFVEVVVDDTTVVIEAVAVEVRDTILVEVTVVVRWRYAEQNTLASADAVLQDN